MSDALPLPPRPNLGQYKKLAQDFQHACKSGDPGAIRDWAAQWTPTLARLQRRDLTPEVRKRTGSDAERVERPRSLEKMRSDARMLAALRGEIRSR